MADKLQKVLDSKRGSQGFAERRFIGEYVDTLQEFKDAYFVEPTAARDIFLDPARDLMDDWGLEEPLETILKRRPNARAAIPAEDLEYMKSYRHLHRGGVAKLKRDKRREAHEAGGDKAA